MKKASHGGSNHLGVSIIDRSGAEQDCSEPEPVCRPQQCTKIVGIIDLVEQQKAIMLARPADQLLKALPERTPLRLSLRDFYPG